MALAGHASPHLAQGCLSAAEFLGHPGAAAGPLERVGDKLWACQDRAQVGPDELVELGCGDEPRRAAAQPAGGHHCTLAQAAVVAVPGVAGGTGDATAAQPAAPAADQAAQ